MTADARSFTHLESLLLFQSVAAYGNTADAFARISSSLKNSELLRRDASNDNDRLNPQALTELYLRLLQTEAKQALQNSSQPIVQDAKKGDAPAASRRSEVHSPKLATIEDAEGHRHLEPLMINRLYDLYKDQVIQEIKEEEDKYDTLVEEVKNLEAELPSDEQSATVAAGSAVEKSDGPPALRSASKKVNSDSPKLDPSKEEGDMGGNRVDALDTKSRQEKPMSKTTSAINTPLSTSFPDVKTSVSSKEPQDISSPTATPSKTAGTSSQSLQPDSRKPPSAPLASSAELSTSQKIVPNLSSTTPSSGNTVSTVSAPTDKNVHPQSSANSQPIPAPNRPLPPSNLHKQSSLLDHFQPNSLHPQQAQQRPLSPYASTSTTRAGGMQLPPFQVSPQAPHQSQQAQGTKQSSAQPLPKQVKTVQGLQNGATPVGKAVGTTVKTPVSSKQTPSFDSSLNKEGPNSYSTPGSDTKWKAMSGVPNVPLPRPRSVSPLSDKTTSPEPTPKPTPSRRQRTTNAGSVRETRQSRATRAGSKTPSAVPSNQARTRSQSIASYDDDSPFPSAPGTVKDLKQETSTLNTDAQPSARQTRATRNATATAVASSGPGKRKRAPTIDTDTAATPASTSGPPSPLPAASSAQRRKTDKATSNSIVASRNFHKMSAPMLNNIGSHKHASLFSAPVSSRTAGYYDIIKRPTDLSTIRKAIHAGVKAVNSATASAIPGTPTVSTPGGSGGGGGGDAGGTVVLPVSKELVPPDAIVNGAQLEQEVMRMFANAVMFNEDEGVVADTQEMSEDTEKTLAAWRAAESNREDGEEVGVGGGTGGDDGSAGASVKRRRA